LNATGALSRLTQSQDYLTDRDDEWEWLWKGMLYMLVSWKTKKG
jgi:hypothetical protein